jgi:hypothetical protein
MSLKRRLDELSGVQEQQAEEYKAVCALVQEATRAPHTEFICVYVTVSVSRESCKRFGTCYTIWSAAVPPPTGLGVLCVNYPVIL